jgi:hypothetical protein
MLVGSPTMQADGRRPSALIAAISRGAPRQPTSSSWVSAMCTGRARPASAKVGAAASAQATKPFMSHAPRP